MTARFEGSYGGDAANAASASASLTQTVNTGANVSLRVVAGGTPSLASDSVAISGPRMVGGIRTHANPSDTVYGIC